ncbi:MAG TPA: SCO family protein [Bauldia sp.]|nr:SCO family protein [Bauldia sp.]
MNTLRIVRYVLWAAVAVLVVAVAAVLYFRESGEAPLVAGGIKGGPFNLIDQHGTPVTEAALMGHPSAMFFGYTFCPDVCPTTLYDMTMLMQQLGPDADRIKFYFVTVDPERDTQQAIAEYLSAFDPRFIGLTGSREEIDRILSGYRVYARKVEQDKGPYLMDHTAAVYLLDEEGALTGTIDYQEPPETALAKLKRLIESS